VQLSVKKEYVNIGIPEVVEHLKHELIGLAPIKKRIQEIAALLLIDRLRKNLELGIQSHTLGLHMSFTGNPGTGKTLVAKRIAYILHKLNYIPKRYVITVTRDDFVGRYIGHTAPQTHDILKKAWGGVLFVDEAYYLYKKENERDYGAEAIEILLQVMENQRTDVVLIFAGYKDLMEKFYEANPGFSSRISNHIAFPDYTTLELIQIARKILQRIQYRMALEVENTLSKCINKRREFPFFSNARTVINMIDKTRNKHAQRLFSAWNKILRKPDLVTFLAGDVMKSQNYQTL